MALLRTLVVVVACISSVAFAAETNVSACFGSKSAAEAVSLGKDEVLARAFDCHPEVLVFPGWEVPLEATA